jgi:hypothetical protein
MKLEEIEERWSGWKVQGSTSEDLANDVQFLISEVKKWKTGCKDLAEEQDRLEAEVKRLQTFQKHLCPECLQMLEPDGSCLTCKMAAEVKRLKIEQGTYYALSPDREKVERLIKGIAEVLDGTLPYLVEQRLRKLLEGE